MCPPPVGLPTQKRNGVVARHCSKKSEATPECLIAECETVAPRVMVSDGVCFGGKGRLHFVNEKAKADAAGFQK